MKPNRYFDLSLLPNDEIRNEMEKFIKYRGRVLTPLSIRSELYPYRQLSRFLSERHSDMITFINLDLETYVKDCKVWLLKNGKNITQRHRQTATGKMQISESEVLKYLKKVVKYFNTDSKVFKYESDVWYLKGIPIILRVNPVKETKSISFKKIPQQQIREEIKAVLYAHLAQKALGTVQAEMTAINRFTGYVADGFPEVKSLHDLDREVIETYLTYINTEATSRKSYAKELCHLKTVLNTAAKVLEDEALETLFWMDDIGSPPAQIYKVYSDSELMRLNAAIVDMDKQIARALMLHQMLGMRISETLTLKQNAVRKGESGRWLIRIEQIKTHRAYEKVINDDVKALFDKSCIYTNENFGKQEYVFVNRKRPSAPMQYGSIQYQLMAMVTQNNLVDDNGEKFGVGTHLFRHCYGKKLTEMHVDDVTLAKLLGHQGTGSVKHYRKIGNEMLSKETKPMRDAMDTVLKSIVVEWDT